MKDQVLYRKYRPSIWDEVIGQEHIVSVLSSSIKNENFSHAYLFTGSRGTGKTSVARIFARELGVSVDDILEIDAASNRGIDDIRALREAVRVLPFSGRFKVYIIDEVHMLSKDAWGALLKTLEEPPAHVIFVMATTELDKVPATILSRCQVFNFRKPNEKILSKIISDIGKKEKFVIDNESSDLIAFLGDGSFRDAFSILQKVFSASENRIITRELVETITGAPSLIVISDIYNALINKDIDQIYKTLIDAENHHTDMMLLAELLLKTMRISLIYRYAPNMRKDIESEYSDSYIEIIKKGAVEAVGIISSKSLISLITAIERISYASVPVLPLELAFIEILEIETSKQ